MRKLILLMVLMMTNIFAYSQDISQIQSEAEKGDSYSQYLLGWSYANGANGAQKSYSAAIPWFKKSAQHGYGAAAYYLGWMYFYGEGVSQNLAEAKTWYNEALRLGVSEAKTMIALCEQGGAGQYRTIDDFDSSRPPILELITNSVKFVDPNGNNAIDAGETCYIEFIVENKGQGVARNCIASISSADVINGLTTDKVEIKAINPGEKKHVRLPIKTTVDLKNGKQDLFVQVSEPHGLGTDQAQLAVSTRGFVAPKLQVVDYAVTSEKGNKISKKQPFDLQILLQNLAPGSAENVSVSFSAPTGVILMNELAKSKNFSTINGGVTKSIEYQLIVNNDYQGTTIPIDIYVKEKYGKYAENKRIELQMNQSLAATKIMVDEKQQENTSFTIETASLTSDVDKNIPTGSSKDSENTFAVIIANEVYNKEGTVPFASNDGKIFAEYCKQTLGLAETNIKLVVNATLNDMRHEISWLRKVIETRKGKAKVIFYYAGHGIPDESTKSSYLLPIDGYGSDVSTGYSLENLYNELSSESSKSVLVVLDACFSGAKREGDMLASARGVALKADRGEPKGNMVVFSAAQGDETAYPYKKEGHGLFTYYLLKKIQETKGDVSLKDLGDYVTEKVSQQSIVVNNKPQTPVVLVSKDIINSWDVLNFK